jgi:hypothetical protein
VLLFLKKVGTISVISISSVSSYSLIFLIPNSFSANFLANSSSFYFLISAILAPKIFFLPKTVTSNKVNISSSESSQKVSWSISFSFNFGILSLRSHSINNLETSYLGTPAFSSFFSLF